jgi:hypothetical protein
MRQAFSVRNVEDDRKVGAFWEGNFCQLLPIGTKYTRHQLHRTRAAIKEWIGENGKIHTSPLPDVTVFHGLGRESNHELKHKNPTSCGQFGLEVYRFEAMLQHATDAFGGANYTIHDWQKNGGKVVLSNDIHHWVTASFLDLKEPDGYSTEWGSWVDGRWTENVPMYFWNQKRFLPLSDFLNDIAEDIRMDLAFGMRLGRRVAHAH